MNQEEPGRSWGKVVAFDSLILSQIGLILILPCRAFLKLGAGRSRGDQGEQGRELVGPVGGAPPPHTPPSNRAATLELPGLQGRARGSGGPRDLLNQLGVPLNVFI